MNRSFTYQITEAGASQTVAGQFLGTDYTITDTAGKIWVREGSFTKVLRRTDSVTGQPTGEFAAITGGIRLDSFNSTTDEVVFTIAPESADATQFTGTLSRKGLGFLDAWLYDGLETSAGRDRAIVDIEKAKRTIDLELARYGSALTTAQFYEGRNGVRLNNFAGRIDELTDLTGHRPPGSPSADRARGCPDRPPRRRQPGRPQRVFEPVHDRADGLRRFPDRRPGLTARKKVPRRRCVTRKSFAMLSVLSCGKGIRSNPPLGRPYGRVRL